MRKWSAVVERAIFSLWPEAPSRNHPMFDLAIQTVVILGAYFNIPE
ncbi:hypothetical protein [Mesorhizobium prunaredense]|nr:hypothetical protein [Mesorhizobium prunaredense]